MSVVILRGDAASLPMPDASADLIVTSPPYWSQRDYRDGGESLKGQIGNEETWQEYLANLLDCTREWVRVLKPGGSIFVVIGDKYANDAKWGGATSGKHVKGLHGQTGIGRARVRTGIPAKSLIGLPWRYALACVDELGLINRRDNIWHKTSGMPESVDDRCATKHEYAFHLTREPRYYSAIDDIREAHVPVSLARSRRAYNAGDRFSVGTPNTLNPAQFGVPMGALPGSVWSIAAQPLNVPEWLEHARCCGGRKRPDCQDGLDHHAAFPPALARKCILGWSPSGICAECGDGRRPVADVANIEDRKGRKQRIVDYSLDAAHGPDGRGGERWKQTVRITGYACACPRPDAPTRPAVVVDPFGGTGTTSLVADMLGRTGVTIDRSMDYSHIAAWRTSDPGERARALGVPKPPPIPEGQGSLFEAGEAS